MKISDESKALSALIAEKFGLRLSLTTPYVNLRSKQFDYQVDLSRGSESMATEFHCGWGHVTINKMMLLPSFCHDVPYHVEKKLKSGNACYIPEYPRFFKIVPPCLTSIIHCLILDSSAVGQDFESWCADFEYDSDSRKALATYEACCKNGHALKRLLGTDFDEIAKLLEDY